LAGGTGSPALWSAQAKIWARPGDSTGTAEHGQGCPNGHPSGIEALLKPASIALPAAPLVGKLS